MRRHRQLAGLGAIAIVWVLWMGAGGAEPPAGQSPPLSDYVTKVLQARIEVLRARVTADPVVLQAVRDANVTFAARPLSDVTVLDAQWQAKAPEAEGLVKALLTNACTERLVEFQDAQEGYAEIFLTDARGLNVCMTNRTSDYYQADEDWWIRGYADGRGLAFHGDIEYDESAMSESIPVYLPIRDPDTRRAIGVLKAVIDLLAIKREL